MNNIELAKLYLVKAIKENYNNKDRKFNEEQLTENLWKMPIDEIVDVYQRTI